MCIAGFSQYMFTTVERVQGLVYELLYEKKSWYLSLTSTNLVGFQKNLISYTFV